MKVTLKNLPQSQIELFVELSIEEFKPFAIKAAQKISKQIKIDGFRPGYAPYNLVKSKIGEMTILEEASRIGIARVIDKAIVDNIKQQIIGQPQIKITKLAPDNPLEFKIVVSLLPEIKVGPYKDLQIKKQVATVEDKESEATLNQLREMRVVEKISTKPAVSGNKVLVNIQMYLDNVPVEGGQSNDTAIIIGKDYIVPGFDKHLLETKKDDIKTFKLPYPEDHYMKNLAGKLVDFKVVIKEVYERNLPELNDDFAKNFGLKKMDELKKNITKSIEQEKQRDLDQKCEIAILDKILEKSKSEDLPEDLVNHEADGMMHEFKTNITRQGGNFNDYLLSVKTTPDKLMLDMLPQAVKRVKSALIIQKIAEIEKIDVLSEEVEIKRQELLTQYKGNKNVEDRISQPEYSSHLRTILINQKVMEKLRDWNLV